MDARHGPASSDLTASPLTDRHETVLCSSPRLEVTDPSPAFSQGAPSCVWPEASCNPSLDFKVEEMEAQRIEIWPGPQSQWLNPN